MRALPNDDHRLCEASSWGWRFLMGSKQPRGPSQPLSIGEGVLLMCWRPLCLVWTYELFQTKRYYSDMCTCSIWNHFNERALSTS